MKMFGRFQGGRRWLCLTGLLCAVSLLGLPAMALDWGPVPEDATYLGTPMGGEFVRLKRQDMLLDGHLTLPAFHMEIYAAGSKGAAYGEERYGALLFSGVGLFVPPTQTSAPLDDPYEVPSAQFVLENGWVNSDVLHVRMRPKSEDPNDIYIGLILPLNLLPAPQ